MPVPVRACTVCGSEDVSRIPRLMTGGGMTASTFLALRWGEISSVGRFEAQICLPTSAFQLTFPEIDLQL